MKTEIIWQEGMEFNGESAGHSVAMDAKSPIGKDRALTPKELVAIGLGGCTAMDVIAYLKKYKQIPEAFHTEVEIQTSVGGPPSVFTSAILTYKVEGSIESARLLEAVTLSQTKWCGVSAMLSQAFPISYRVLLNDQEIGNGSANFDLNKKEIA